MSLGDDMLIIFNEILEKKILEKHEQYGESLENPINIFNGLMNPQLLIDVRIDDKLSRIRQLSNEDPKYWSEIKEIIAYLMWKILLKEQSNPIHPNDTINSASLAAIEHAFKEGDFEECRYCPYFLIETKDDGKCLKHNYHVYTDELICQDALDAREAYDESCRCNNRQEREPFKSS